MTNETTGFCFNCGNPVEPGRKFCNRKCNLTYHNKKAWERIKDIPPAQRRNSFYLTPKQSAQLDTTTANRVAFMEALDECCKDVQDQILCMIDKLAAVLETERKLGEAAAYNQATDFVARCVWTKATAPRAQ